MWRVDVQSIAVTIAMETVSVPQSRKNGPKTTPFIDGWHEIILPKSADVGLDVMDETKNKNNYL